MVGGARLEIDGGDLVQLDQFAALDVHVVVGGKAVVEGGGGRFVGGPLESGPGLGHVQGEGAVNEGWRLEILLLAGLKCQGRAAGRSVAPHVL